METVADPVEAAATTAAQPDAHKPLPVPELPPRVLFDLVTDCNLKCPMCIVHGHTDDPRLKDYLKKAMPLEDAKRVLDEIMSAKPLVMPSMWSEPTMSPQFKEHVAQMKAAGLTTAMNTNGLKMTPELAQFLVDIKFDSVFFSVDSMKPETLKKVRGITRLDLIHKGVETLQKARGNNPLPRIGVSMTLQPTNRHERDEFVAFWTPRVDAVRIGELYENGHFPSVHPLGERVPCSALYSTLAINTNGSVSICCLDSFNGTSMGNVFKEGVKAVWHGRKLTAMRQLHERGQWDKIPLCRNCERWASYKYEEEIRDGLLIRRCPEYTYYNRIDRLKNWHNDLHGTHGVSEKFKEASYSCAG